MTDTRANIEGVNLKNYKIVNKYDFVYNPSRINLGSIALSDIDKCIVSPMYIVFEVTNIEKILPEFLMLWFARDEFKRSTWFYASGSVRDTFGFSSMQAVKIPIPELSVQQAIVDIYKVLLERRQINEQLKQQIKQICPVLIRGATEEMVGQTVN